MLLLPSRKKTRTSNKAAGAAWVNSDFLMSTVLYLLFAAVSGCVLGAVFGWVWNRMMPMRRQREFLGELQGKAERFVRAVGQDDFLTHYKNLILSLLGYSGRNMLALFAACLPIILFVVSAGWWTFDAWNRSAPELYEQGAASVLFAEDEDPHLVRIATPGAVEAFGYSLLGYAVELRQSDPKALRRPTHGDWNPAWPILSDLEFIFYLCLTIGSLGGFVLFAARGGSPRGD